MSKPRGVRKLAEIAGLVFTLLSLAFVAFEFYKNWDTIATWQPNLVQLAQLSVITLVYSACLYFQVESWHRIVSQFGEEPRHRTYPSVTLTQIAKYLPGNVFHMVGRAFYLREGALSDRQLGVATITEIAVMACAAVTSVLILVPFVSANYFATLPIWPELRFVAPLLAFMALGLLITFGPRLARAFDIPISKVTPILISLILSIGFMLVMAFSFAGTLSLFNGTISFVAVSCAMVIAWLIGYVTPGAPGGLGVREAVLIALLQITENVEYILLATVLFRVITVIGDLVLFVSGKLIANRLRANGTLPDSA